MLRNVNLRFKNNSIMPLDLSSIILMKFTQFINLYQNTNKQPFDLEGCLQENRSAMEVYLPFR